MKHTVYTAPALEKVELAAVDILLTSGTLLPGEYELRGGLNTFNTESAQYQRKTWEEFFSN